MTPTVMAATPIPMTWHSERRQRVPLRAVRTRTDAGKYRTEEDEYLGLNTGKSLKLHEENYPKEKARRTMETRKSLTNPISTREIVTTN